jgi:hypothetical protein
MEFVRKAKEIFEKTKDELRILFEREKKDEGKK